MFAFVLQAHGRAEAACFNNLSIGFSYCNYFNHFSITTSFSCTFNHSRWYSGVITDSKFTSNTLICYQNLWTYFSVTKSCFFIYIFCIRLASPQSFHVSHDNCSPPGYKESRNLITVTVKNKTDSLQADEAADDAVQAQANTLQCLVCGVFWRLEADCSRLGDWLMLSGEGMSQSSSHISHSCSLSEQSRQCLTHTDINSPHRLQP